MLDRQGGEMGRLKPFGEGEELGRARHVSQQKRAAVEHAGLHAWRGLRADMGILARQHGPKQPVDKILERSSAFALTASLNGPPLSL